MNFKASKPDARILILQIVAASILSFYFKSQLATFCFFLVIDFLIFFWYGAKVFFQRLVAYACLNALTCLSWRFPFFRLCFRHSL